MHNVYSSQKYTASQSRRVKS